MLAYHGLTIIKIKIMSAFYLGGNHSYTHVLNTVWAQKTHSRRSWSKPLSIVQLSPVLLCCLQSSFEFSIWEWLSNYFKYFLKIYLVTFINSPRNNGTIQAPSSSFELTGLEQKENFLFLREKKPLLELMWLTGRRKRNGFSNEGSSLGKKSSPRKTVKDE